MAKTALVIGASRGLGLGLAGELAARGWRVVATARDPAKALGLAQLAAERPGEVKIETVDVDDKSAANALADRLKGQAFDLIFLNAGILGPAHQSVEDVTIEEIGQLIYTNAVAPVRLARHLLAQVKPGGIIAFMTSQLGSVANNTSGGSNLYRASKAALNMLTRSFVATDLGGANVTVLSLHPGWVRTDMGGHSAPLDVATSVKGLADLIEARAGSGGHAYLNYKGEKLPW